MRAWILVSLSLALSSTACVSGAVGPCFDDPDFDGLCDADGSDPCPNDTLNDADGDGFCDGTDDACVGFDDAIDEDEDGLPDGCDDCPGDPGNDPDDDGICAADDLCPESADDDCDLKVTVALQVDLFPDDATWSVFDYRGSLVEDGDFGAPGEGGYLTFDVPVAKTTCVQVRDSEGDGGIRGLIFHRPTKTEYASWDAGDYTRQDSFCFNPSEDGRTTQGFLKEADWVDQGACTVNMRVYTGQFPEELGWALETKSGRIVEAIATGTYKDTESEQWKERPVTVTSGDYVLRLLDAYGDGWDGAGDDASFEMVLQGEGAPFLTGTLEAGGATSGVTEGTYDVTVDCGG